MSDNAECGSGEQIVKSLRCGRAVGKKLRVGDKVVVGKDCR